MRPFLAIFIFIAVLLQSFSKGMVELSFYLNRDYIEKNLCENRNSPELSCKGTCHLKKEFHKESKREQTLSQNDKEVFLFFNPCFSSIKLNVPEESAQIYPVLNDRFTNKISLPIFHPPGFNASSAI